jgi:hypothetical protein
MVDYLWPEPSSTRLLQLRVCLGKEDLTGFGVVVACGDVHEVSCKIKVVCYVFGENI